MSIQSEINRLVQAKQNIIAAITAKGVTVPADSSLDDLTALVQAIETGSDITITDDGNGNVSITGMDVVVGE